MEPLHYIVLPNTVVVVVEGKDYAISDNHPNYLKVREAVRLKDVTALQTLVDIPKTIHTASSGKVAVVDGVVYFGEKPVNTYLTTRILALMSEGFDVQPWLLFMNKLYDNPSYRAVQELYPFLEKGKLPLCPDGDFLAYKYVRSDYRDQRTGTFDNSVGKTVTMPRNEVDDNRDRTCSAGLHFCSREYLPNYGNGTGTRVVLVKVNPADVVSIPADHNDQKARTWRYEVVGELDEDYTFEDFAKSQVLPAPRNKQSLNSTKGKSSKSVEDRIVAHLNKNNLARNTVREIAKNLGLTNSDVINSLGKKLYTTPDNVYEMSQPVSKWFVHIKRKYAVNKSNSK
jgi:hypothetical protein